MEVGTHDMFSQEHLLLDVMKIDLMVSGEIISWQEITTDVVSLTCLFDW